MTQKYTFKTKLWIYSGKAAWHFVTLPVDVAQDIDFYFADKKRGWGSLPVQVTIGKTSWNTSIFPDKNSGSYLLPIKADVRKKEKLSANDVLSIILELTR